jgi:threonine dehydrogenase-like Zn-dependent dehydrogenase
MRAAVLRDQKLVVDTIPDPVPGPGEVLVRTLACGICGSDLHALQHAQQLVDMAVETGSPFVMDLSKDIVMGHEFCAEIVDHGPGTQKLLQTGTRICSMPVAIAPSGVQGVGYSNERPGGYGELMLLPELLLLEVPNGLETERAALTEPMAVGLHAVEMARLEARDVPLVIGCGPVGLSVIAALRLKGAAPIVAADFSPRRRALAEALGADVVVDPKERSPYESWRELAREPGEHVLFPGLPGTPAYRPEVIFECVGVPGVLQQIIRGAERGSRVVVAGVCMENDSIRPAYGIGKELNVQFVLGYTPEEFARTLQSIAEGAIDVEPLITGRVGVTGVAAAFEALANPEEHAKILVEPWRD